LLQVSLIIAFLLSITSPSLTAESFKVNINDTEQNTSIKILANQILDHIEIKKLPLREQIAINLVAQKYNEASEAITLLTKESRKLNPWVTELFTIHYRSYVDAKIRMIKEPLSFEEAFTISLLKAHKTVASRYSVYSTDSFAGNLPRQKQLLLDLVKRHPKNELTLKQSKNLVMQFSRWMLLEQTQHLANKLLKEQELKYITEQKNIKIPLEDGSYLEAKVYLPTDRKNKLPAILIYNLYAEGWSIDTKAKEAAMSGYAGVLVYGRGKGISNSKIAPFEHEAIDGYNIINWISKQDWSNQKVGMYGGSYLGFTQWAATKKLHPALKTIVPSTAVVPGLNDNLTENGILSTNSLPWFHLVGNNSTMDFGAYYDPRWQKMQKRWFKLGASFQELDEIDGTSHKLFQKWLKHQDYNDYWQKMVPYKQDFKNINIPILSTTGFYDHAQHGSTYFFNEHYKYNKQADHYLLIGPYEHLGASSMPRPTVNGYSMDKVAHISIDNVIYEWFDHILNNGKKPKILKNKVNYQVMGTNKWAHSSTIETMANSRLKLYLELNETNENLKITQKPSLNLTHKDQIIDFKDRTKINNSIRFNILNKKVNQGGGIELVSAPFEQSFDISGMFSGTLSVEINKKDMDFIVALYELLPNGQYFKLSHFKGRASYLSSPTKRQLLTPQKKEKLTFSNTHIVSKHIEKGSRLVVVINGNKNQNDQINYGTGNVINNESITDAKEPLQIKWFNDSFINIPINHIN